MACTDDNLMKMATLIHVPAVMRAGQFLNEIEDSSGRRTDREPGRDAPTRLTKGQAAEAAGMSKGQQMLVLRPLGVGLVADTLVLGLLKRKRVSLGFLKFEDC